MPLNGLPLTSRHGCSIGKLIGPWPDQAHI
jgi:hypothetical protein